MTEMLNGSATAADAEVQPEPATNEPTKRKARTSYAEILASSALIGGSSVMALLIGLVRTKAMAMLLGPAGFGLFGMYLAIADLARAFAEMGINGSGVRQIAASVGSGDAARVALTAAVLRRVAVILGLIGATVLALVAVPVSNLTFGTEERAAAVAVLGLAVFCRLVADGQGALLQGMRRIADLARINILGALFGATASIIIVYSLGDGGVALAVVAAAVSGLAVSWWYARRVPLAKASPTGATVAREAGALLKLGFAFMTSGTLMMGAAYAVRTIVLRSEGLDAAGFYSAAWSLGGLYIGIVLQAMGTDFYPRLVGAIEDSDESNLLVNQQAQVSLLLAGPGVLATLALAPLALWILYSPSFVAATELLRWTCLGIALRVVTWPIGYIIVARNARTLFVTTELFWAALNVGLTLILVPLLGLEGAGIAFFLSYVAHGIVIYTVVRRLNGFRWSSGNLLTGGLYLASIVLTFVSFFLLPTVWAMVIAIFLALVNMAHAIRVGMNLLAEQDLPAPLCRLFVRLGRARSNRVGRTWET